MDAQTQPEIVLYDLACTKNECFSPAAWRVRLMLNYKRVPYKTVFLGFHEIQETLKGLDLTPGAEQPKYTVPVIHHLPTDTHIMDSLVIARFLEETYPAPPVPGIGSEASEELLAQVRSAAMLPFRTSVTPREVLILSPPAAAYFRRTREPVVSGGQPLEVLLEGGKEEEAWSAADAELRELGEKLRARRGEGPFIFGAGPAWADFTMFGNLQCARVVDEATFQRLVSYPGLGEVYEAVLPFAGKKD